jgi:RNA-directed DNA polymerase
MWKDYEAELERNLEDLHNRVQSGAYRARPSRRVYIPKPDGRQRPLAVATVTSNYTSIPSAFGFG